MGQNLTIVCINKRCKKFFHLGRMSLMSQKAFLNKQLKERRIRTKCGKVSCMFRRILTNLDGVQVIGSIIVISKIVIRNVVVVIVVVVIVVALV